MLVILIVSGTGLPSLCNLLNYHAIHTLPCHTVHTAPHCTMLQLMTESDVVSISELWTPWPHVLIFLQTLLLNCDCLNSTIFYKPFMSLRFAYVR